VSNGATWTVNIRHGKQYSMARATPHYTQFKVRGIWEEILDKLVVLERSRQGKQGTPSLLAIDSQSVKKMQFVSQETGIDGGKNVNAGPPVRAKANNPC
jgi:hypothetical protein